MIEELKTLKDIEWSEWDNKVWKKKEELRAEAVRDIKQFRKEIKNKPYDEKVNFLIEYIKWKNNLTEKDLEEKEE